MCVLFRECGPSRATSSEQYTHLTVQRYTTQTAFHVWTCWLDGPEIESRWRRDYSHTSRPTLGHTQLPVQWVPDFSQRKSGRGVVLTTHPLLAPRSRECRVIPLLPLWVFESVTGYLYLFIHASQTGTIFHIFQLLLIYHNLYWRGYPSQDYVPSNGIMIVNN
jgi:hypothetical protein